jgi:hypothetical protein
MSETVMNNKLSPILEFLSYTYWYLDKRFRSIAETGGMSERILTCKSLIRRVLVRMIRFIVSWLHTRKLLQRRIYT